MKRYKGVFGGEKVSDLSKSFDNKRPFKGHAVEYYPDAFTVLDIETTGRSPQKDYISEISMVRYRNGREDAQFSSLLRPPERKYNGYYTSAFSAELTGITHDMLCSAPSYEKVLSEFVDFIGNDVLVGHNVNFDINFLYDNCERYGLGYLNNDYIDTLKLARRMFPEMATHKLGDLAERFHISYVGAHRALTDCYIAKDVLDNLMESAGVRVSEENQISFLR